MGLLSFVANAGKKLLGLGKDEENIKSEIEKLREQAQNIE